MFPRNMKDPQPDDEDESNTASPIRHHFACFLRRLTTPAGMWSLFLACIIFGFVLYFVLTMLQSCAAEREEAMGTEVVLSEPYSEPAKPMPSDVILTAPVVKLVVHTSEDQV